MFTSYLLRGVAIDIVVYKCKQRITNTYKFETEWQSSFTGGSDGKNINKSIMIYYRLEVVYSYPHGIASLSDICCFHVLTIPSSGYLRKMYFPCYCYLCWMYALEWCTYYIFLVLLLDCTIDVFYYLQNYSSKYET